MADLSWTEVRTFLEESEQTLLSEVSRTRQILHHPVPNGWSIAQIVEHLVRTEQVMYLIWTVVPRLRRFPQIVRIADAANSSLFKAMGMRTVEAGSQLEKGRYRAPVFLNPAAHRRDLEQLIAWRRRTRDRSLRAIAAVDEATMNSLRWSHPLFGSYTLMEFARFLGVHERHHVAQIRRIEESLAIPDSSAQSHSDR